MRQRFAVTATARSADSVYGSATADDSRIQVTAYGTMYYSVFDKINYIDGCEGGWYTETGSSVTGNRYVKVQFFPRGGNVIKRPTSNNFLYENLNLNGGSNSNRSMIVEAKVAGIGGATATLKLVVE